MNEITIKLWDTEYKRLDRIAKQSGKTIETLVREWILHFAENERFIDVTKDPIYTMGGSDLDGPEDLSINIDSYIYGDPPLE